jgi:hypothetical protein
MATGYRFDDSPPSKGQKISVFESLTSCERFLSDMPNGGRLPGHKIYEIVGEWHRGSSEFPDGFTIVVDRSSVIRTL